jgi:hypothetical protein
VAARHRDLEVVATEGQESRDDLGSVDDWHARHRDLEVGPIKRGRSVVSWVPASAGKAHRAGERTVQRERLAGRCGIGVPRQ